MKKLIWIKPEIFQIKPRRQAWEKIKNPLTTKVTGMSFVHITEVVWIMQVNSTGNAGTVWIADINRNTNQQPTFFCRRHALIRITPCHRLSIERQKALQNNCRLYSDAAKGGEIYEAFYVTKSSPLYRWLPSLVLGKTLNCPATALSDISIFSIFLTQQVKNNFKKEAPKWKNKLLPFRIFPATIA